MGQILYDILLDINPTLAELTLEIEKLIFISPRSAIQTTRMMAKALTQQMAQLMSELPYQLEICEAL